MTERFIQVETPMLMGYRRHTISAVANLEKTYIGMIHIIMSESKGVYPGGPTRTLERLDIITRHVRPASLSLAKSGDYRQAIDLYRRTFQWHISLGRMKYLFGFWLVLLRAIVANPKHQK